MLNFDRVTSSEVKEAGDETYTGPKPEALSPAMHHAVVAVLNAVTGCMESELLKDEHPRLFIDSLIALWSFARPLLEDLEFITDAKAYSNLTEKNLVVLVLKALDTIQAEYPTENVYLGIAISAKLALVYEVLENYRAAIQVSALCVDRIRLCREDISEGVSSVHTATCSLHMHPKHEVRTRGQSYRKNNEMSWVDVKTQLESYTSPSKESDTAALLKSLPCLELDMVNNLIRCRMKHQFMDDYNRNEIKSSQHFRLTHKRLDLAPPVSRPSDIDIEKICMDNPVLKAMVNITYASSGRNLSMEERKSMLKDAERQLIVAKSNEERYLREIVPLTTRKAKISQPILARKSFSSMTLRMSKIAPPGAKYYQLFARPTLSDKVTVKDITLHGTGEFFPISSDADVKITGLMSNMNYSYAAAFYDEDKKQLGRVGESIMHVVAGLPLPISVCWGYLANAAGAANCREVSDKARLRLLDYFVPERMNDAEVVRLSRHTKRADGSLFHIDEERIKYEPPSATRSLIHSILMLSERTSLDKTEFIETSDIRGLQDKRVM
jgi:hypothetical protein